MSIQVTIISLDFDSDEKPRTESFDKGIIKIGKAQSNDIVLNSEDVADFHAQIRIEGDDASRKLFLTDLGTGLGTRLENISIDPQTEVDFEFNKRISIGSYLIKPLHKTQDSISTASSLRKKFSTPRSSPSNVVVRDDFLKAPLEENNKVEEKIEVKKEVPPQTFKPIFKQSEAVKKPIFNQGATQAPKDFRIDPATTAKFPTIQDDREVTKKFSMNDAVNNLRNSSSFNNDNNTEVKMSLNDTTVENKVDRSGLRSIVDESGMIPTTKSTLIATLGKNSNNFNTQPTTSIETKEENNQATSVAQGTQASKPVENTVSQAVNRSSTIIDESSALSIKTEGDDISDLDFEAIELFDLKGTVKNKGQGVAGIKLNLGSLGEITSDNNGNFVCNEIEEDTSYNVEIENDKYKFNFDNKSGIINKDINIDITAIKLFTIEGIVTLDGQAVQGANVDAGRIGKTTSGPDGRYQFRNVEEDSIYEIMVLKDKLTFDKNKLSGTLTADITNLNFNAKKLLIVSGRVMHKGKPLEGVEIDAGDLGTTLTDSDGFYKFDNALDGVEYTIKAKKGKFSFGTKRGVRGK